MPDHVAPKRTLVTALRRIHHPLTPSLGVLLGASGLNLQPHSPASTTTRSCAYACLARLRSVRASPRALRVDVSSSPAFPRRETGSAPPASRAWPTPGGSALASDPPHSTAGRGGTLRTPHGNGQGQVVGLSPRRKDPLPEARGRPGSLVDLGRGANERLSGRPSRRLRALSGLLLLGR